MDDFSVKARSGLKAKEALINSANEMKR